MMLSDNSKDFLSDNESIHNASSVSSATDPVSGVISKEINRGAEAGVLWKVVVVALLLVNGTLAGFTYLWGLITRDNLVQSQFYIYAEQIAKKSVESSKLMAESLGMITNHVQSVAIIEGTNWPFHSLENFEHISQDFQFVGLAPLVSDEDRILWEAYSVENKHWIENLMNATEKIEGEHFESDRSFHVPGQIFRRRYNGEHFIEYGQGPYAPLWQYTHTPMDPSSVNFNLLSMPVLSHFYQEVVEYRHSVLSEILNMSDILGNTVPIDKSHPISLILQPIFSNFSREAHVVGATLAAISWKNIFENTLPVGADGISCVVTSNCGHTFTYQIDGRDAVFLGEGDFHDDEFDYLVQVSAFDLTVLDDKIDDDVEKNNDRHCQKHLHTYPSKKFYDVHHSNTPNQIAGCLVLIFFFTCAVFKLYDTVVNVVQWKLERGAQGSNKIISSLFPQELREVLKQANDDDVGNPYAGNWQSNKARLDSYLSGDNQSTETTVSKPIATLFPDATVSYADIAGFTAWSSAREPEYVFKLLENIFSAFDDIAKRRRVFKVETVGDCYVAVTGLPRPQKDHAVIMTKFSRDCIRIMNALTSKLELSLGPGTCELAMRIGLHSGPITAGVLRGKKSRFQLFGDTVNVASRIESSGTRNKIHISEETANLLIAAGKSSWVQPREEKIALNGNDEFQTFWALCKDQALTNQGYNETASSSNGKSFEDIDDGPYERAEDSELPLRDERRRNIESAQLERLIRWNTDVLGRLLADIIANRNFEVKQNASYQCIAELEKAITANAKALEEVTDHIDLPVFRKDKQLEQKSVQLQHDVAGQLFEYVTEIASLYRNNPFHSFQHASHVVVSMNKLLFRVGVSHDFEDNKDFHHNARGVTSDPLTRFALIFSALIHDVDHRGLTNFQLVEEKTRVANSYNNKSVSEQNSVDIAWKLLMEDRFTKLRQSMYTNEYELRRFRQTIVNMVISTDVFDEDQRKLRIQRWNRVFAHDHERSFDKLVVQHDASHKATVVIEHLVLASYFAHAMQDWQVYQKWNERLFEEMYVAYQSGHSDEDPSINWIKSELRFFDSFVIPVATNLSECGILDVSNDDYLNYAMGNRRELASKGEYFVATMVEKFSQRYSRR